MGTVRMFYLLTVTLICSLPVRAEDCSGGVGGGVDATGNECNVPDMTRFNVSSSAESPQLIAKSGGKKESVAVGQHVRPQVWMPVVARTHKTEPGDRFRNVAFAPATPMKTSKINMGMDAECSGGADGGMDAMGNQCSKP